MEVILLGSQIQCQFLGVYMRNDIISPVLCWGEQKHIKPVNTAISFLALNSNHWRRKWQTTPVLLPGEFHGQKSLVRYSPWGHKEPDTTERLTHTQESLLPNTPTCIPGENTQVLLSSFIWDRNSCSVEGDKEEPLQLHLWGSYILQKVDFYTSQAGQNRLKLREQANSGTWWIRQNHN